MNKYLSIITLNETGLNAPIKRHRVAEWIRKQDPYICCLQDTHLRTKDTHRLQVKGWKKTFHANGKGKKARAAILICDKKTLKPRLALTGVAPVSYTHLILKGTHRLKVKG